jgi:hypothetical protein
MPLLPSTSRSSRARGLKHGLRHGERVDLPSRSSRARGFAAYDAMDGQVGTYRTAEEAIAAIAEHVSGGSGARAREEVAPADERDAEPGVLIRRRQ